MNYTITLQNCNYCGMLHQGMCPKIKSIEYFENGLIKKIEFKDYSQVSIEPLKDQSGTGGLGWINNTVTTGTYLQPPITLTHASAGQFLN